MGVDARDVAPAAGGPVSNSVIVLVAAMSTWAGERGLDARAPILIGALRAIERFRPADLIGEANDGQRLARVLSQQVGRVVRTGVLGPTIGEEDALALLGERAGRRLHRHVVPFEATAAIAMCLLRRSGIVTVNTQAQPGARVSIRLKPASGHLARPGGTGAVATEMALAVDEAADRCRTLEGLARLVLGDESTLQITKQQEVL